MNKTTYWTSAEEDLSFQIFKSDMTGRSWEMDEPIPTTIRNRAIDIVILRPDLARFVMHDNTDGSFYTVTRNWDLPELEYYNGNAKCRIF